MIKANQEVHKRVAWYFEWLKKKKKGLATIDQGMYLSLF